MGSNHVTVLNNLIQTAIKKISLNPEQRILVQTTVSRVIREYMEELGDPFRELTQALGPTFDRIKTHEKDLETLVDEFREVSTGFTKMVKNSTIHRTVTVRRNHRIVIKELPEGTALRKEVYRSKRAQTCPDCEGTEDENCKTCKGTGEIHPVRGVMLEVL